MLNAELRKPDLLKNKSEKIQIFSKQYIYMVQSYCVKQKKQTECFEPSGIFKTKNGRIMFFCTCSECGIKKTKIISQKGTGIMGTVDDTALDLAITKGIPWYGKTAVEMGRYFMVLKL